MNDADTIHRTYASAPPVDPPDPLTEPAVEPVEPAPMPPDPFPADPDTPTLPEPAPDPGGLPPSRSPFPMP